LFFTLYGQFIQHHSRTKFLIRRPFLISMGEKIYLTEFVPLIFYGFLDIYRFNFRN